MTPVISQSWNRPYQTAHGLRICKDVEVVGPFPIPSHELNDVSMAINLLIYYPFFAQLFDSLFCKSTSDFERFPGQFDTCISIIDLICYYKSSLLYFGLHLPQSHQFALNHHQCARHLGLHSCKSHQWHLIHTYEPPHQKVENESKR